MTHAPPVRQITTPTPYDVGPVNAYLIEGEPLTLIDSGINSEEAQAALLAQLNSAGVAPEDIGRVLVTHAHPDHYGLAQFVGDRAGVPVHFPAREISRIRDREVLLEWGKLLMRAGMPPELLLKMDEARRTSPRPKLDFESLVPISGGDVFESSAGPLEVHESPGHTGGHVVFLAPGAHALFAGDQLLPNVSPNPLLEPSVDEPGERRRSLEEYLASLRKMAAMDLGVAYPGHGEPVADPQALIQRTIEHHLRRKAKVAGHLDGRGKSPYEVASELYPRVRGYETFLAVSEVVAHLDLVVDDGDALIDERDGISYYLAAKR